MTKFQTRIILVLGIGVFVCLFLIITGSVSLSFNGFAVDEQGQLYIGRDNTIVVLNNREYSRSISPHTSRTYKFTIINDESIILSTSSEVYVMDLYGNVLQQYPDDDTSVYNQLQRQSRHYIASDGTKYAMKRHWGRIRIYKEDEIVYEMPLHDYTVYLILIILSIFVFLVCIIYIIKFKIIVW